MWISGIKVSLMDVSVRDKMSVKFETEDGTIWRPSSAHLYVLVLAKVVHNLTKSTEEVFGIDIPDIDIYSADCYYDNSPDVETLRKKFKFSNYDLLKLLGWLHRYCNSVKTLLPLTEHPFSSAAKGTVDYDVEDGIITNVKYVTRQNRRKVTIEYNPWIWLLHDERYCEHVVPNIKLDQFDVWPSDEEALSTILPHCKNRPFIGYIYGNMETMVVICLRSGLYFFIVSDISGNDYQKFIPMEELKPLYVNAAKNVAAGYPGNMFVHNDKTIIPQYVTIHKDGIRVPGHATFEFDDTYTCFEFMQGLHHAVKLYINPPKVAKATKADNFELAWNFLQNSIKDAVLKTMPETPLDSKEAYIHAIKASLISGVKLEE